MKKLLPILLIVALLVVGLLFLKRSGPGSPATVWEQKTEMRVEAVAFFDEFIQDETGANEKYLNKIIEVSGEVSTVRSGSQGSVAVVLKTNDPAFGVRCRLDQPPGSTTPTFQVGESVTFKCVCSGHVQDVEMVQCVEK
ncbi:MAG: hypothetical protein HY842_01280 [Bacteroidetes bacterium]|nr:hypothetical protein [Bacteroidota bacterium]